jgi:RNA polymerase sigma factor (sigma-70 family)
MELTGNLVGVRKPILSSDHERELIRRSQTGDLTAKEELAKSFDRQVRKIAGEYHVLPFEDRVQAGMVGLLKAVHEFDLKSNFRLATPVAAYVRNELREATKKFNRHDQWGETRQDRYLYHNRDASAEEVVAAVGGTVEDAKQAIELLDGGHVAYDTIELSPDDEDGDVACYDEQAGRLFDEDNEDRQVAQNSEDQQVAIESSAPIGGTTFVIGAHWWNANCRVPRARQGKIPPLRWWWQPPSRVKSTVRTIFPKKAMDAGYRLLKRIGRLYRQACDVPVLGPYKRWSQASLNKIPSAPKTEQIKSEAAQIVWPPPAVRLAELEQDREAYNDRQASFWNVVHSKSHLRHRTLNIAPLEQELAVSVTDNHNWELLAKGKTHVRSDVLVSDTRRYGDDRRMSA